LRLEVARLEVGVVTGQAAPRFNGQFAARKDGDAMMPGLPMPDRAVAGGLDGADRKGRIRGLDLLQAGNVRSRLVQPFEQAWQAAVDAVDVEARQLQSAMAWMPSSSRMERAPSPLPCMMSFSRSGVVSRLRAQARSLSSWALKSRTCNCVMWL